MSRVNIEKLNETIAKLQAKREDALATIDARIEKATLRVEKANADLEKLKAQKESLN